MEISPLYIALFLLVAVAVWAVVEVALTVRRSRRAIDELTRTVSDTVAEARPIMAKLDGIADELGPASKQLDPLLEKASASVDALSLDLVRVDGILGDVSTVTGTASNVTTTVNKATSAAADAAVGLIGRLAGRPACCGTAELGAADEPVPSGDDASPADGSTSDAGYFTYPTGGGEGEGAATTTDTETK